MDTGKSYLESFTDNTPAAGIALQTPLPKRSKMHKNGSKNVEIKKIAMAPVSGSEPRINQVNKMVDRMFLESLKSQKQ